MLRDNSTLSDALQREQGIDPQRSFIVQAPAGSGKTELLIQRFLSLLKTVERPEEILAITFTRKAAGEMRHRLAESLLMAQGPRPEPAHSARTWDLARSVLERDVQFGWRLLENPSLFAIQTIDSFNAGLVRRMPWLSRLGGLPEIAGDAETLYRQAADRVLERLKDGGEEGEALELLLSHLDTRMDLLRDLLADMLPKRDQWLRHIIPGNPQRERAHLEQALRSLVSLHLSLALDSIPNRYRNELLELGRFAADNLGAESTRPLCFLRDVRSFPSSDPEDLSSWLGFADLLLTSSGAFRKRLDKNCGFPPGKGVNESKKEALLGIIDQLSMLAEAEGRLSKLQNLPPVAFSDGQWQVLKALTDILLLAAAELWIVFGLENRADFSEIALKALQSLREEEQPSELLLKLDRRISHILVDEFQDTSTLQYALLNDLISGWEPGDGRTLFLVGDPMQSIYRFREAEVGLFLQARSSGIGALRLEALNLRSNFRSQGGLVQWFNTGFASLFPSMEDVGRGAVSYSTADPVHDGLPGHSVRFHPMRHSDVREEASVVTELIQQAREEFPEGTIAILVRSRSHLVQILAALRTREIPYQARDIDSLGKSPVARDILSLTKALLHPADKLSWLAVLRAPWCGLRLADLHILSTLESARTVAEIIQNPEALDALSAEGKICLQRVAPVLRRGLGVKGRVSVRALVEGCWLALGGPVCTDSSGLVDADSVFDLLDRLDRGGDVPSFERLEEELSKLFSSGETPSGNFIHVMTIHKAKGLEFDTVILPGLGRSPRPGDKPLLRWLEYPGCGLLMAPVDSRNPGEKDPVFEVIGRLQRDKEELEVTRLLYVAATRAKKRLHLIGHAARNSKDEFRPASGSLLQKLWPVVSDAFQDLDPRDDSSADNQDTEAQALCIKRLPVTWTLPSVETLAFPKSPKAQTPSEAKEMDADRTMFSGWEAEPARHVGTIAHGYLEAMARDGLDKWSLERVENLSDLIRNKLNALGVPLAEAEGNVPKVLRALKNALQEDRGRWILGGGDAAATELAISGIVKGRTVHAVVDRTFVDVSGVRWIIDYKISEPSGMSIEQFLTEESEKYACQVETYRELFRNMEPGRVVRAALYFPLFNGWREFS